MFLVLRPIAHLPLWQLAVAVCGGLLGAAAAAVRLRRAGALTARRILPVGPRTREVLAAGWEMSPLAMAAVDRAGMVTHWNPAAERLLGWTRHEAVGRPLPVVPEDGEDARRPPDVPAGPGVDGDLRLHRRDGGVAGLHVTARPAGGGRVLVLRDAELGGPEETAANGSRHGPAGFEGLPAIEEAERRGALLERMLALGRSLRRPAGVPAVARTVVEGALRLGADRAAVYLKQPDGTLACGWVENVSARYVDQVLHHARQIAAGHVMDGARPDLLEISGREIDGSGPVLYADVAALPPAVAVPRITDAEGYRALGSWPLVYEQSVVGVLSCYYNTPRVWSEAEEDVLRAFAEDAALALDNAAVRDAQAQRAADLEVLFHLSRRLRTARNPEEIYPILLNQARELLHADVGVLALLEGERGQFDCVASSGLPLDVRMAAFPAAGSPFAGVAASGVTYQTGNFGAQPLPVWFGAFRAVGPAVAVPLRSEEETVGVCFLGRLRRSDAPVFSEAEVRLFDGIAEIGGTAIRRARLFQNLEQSYMQMVVSLARTMDARDSYTSGHSERISEWAEAVARGLGCAEHELQNIRWAALLHDIGKIGVPDAILRKPGRLTDAEWAIMRRHPEIGEKILASTQRMQGVAAMVRHHQEKWDGSGYPDGLKGDEIPLGARILAVCDAFSAITDDRPYKKARSLDEGVAELRRCAGTQFDPRVVDLFCAMITESREREQAVRTR